MKNFSRKGFQLRSASLETRIAYSGFLVLVLLGLVTLVALSFGRIGFDAGALATYYRGSDSEMSFPKTFWQLMEVSHFHLFTIPVVILILTHLLYATPAPRNFKIGVTLASYTGALLDAVGPWAIRYLAAGAAWALILGWTLLAGSAFLIVIVSLVAMWGPERWSDRAGAEAKS